jgi:hypothetical protein
MAELAPKIPSYTSLESFAIKGRGKVYTIANPEECSAFDHFLGAALIDGVERKVIGVERWAKLGPHRKGAPIGLMVAE